MKTRIQYTIIFMLISGFPTLLNAQWSPVRFDSLNYFTHTIALSTDSSISIGVESGSVSSFLLRTTNSGLSWDSISPSTPGNNLLFSCINFINNNHGFAGGSNNGLQSLMYTSDNGSTWIDITPDPASADAINSVSFIDNLTGFASTYTTLYKTIDGGISWTSYIPGFDIFDVKFSNLSTGFIAGHSFPYAVVHKTTDGGVTWNAVLSATDNTFNNPTIQKIDVISSTEVVAMRQFLNILYRTTDGGASWDTITISSIFNLVDFDFSDSMSGHIVSNLSEIFSTTDGGNTWLLEYAAASGAYGPNVFLNSISFIDDIGFVCGSNGLVKKHDASTTSIGEHNNVQQMNIYPNPVKHGSVVFIDTANENTIVEVYSTTGSLIQKTMNNKIETDKLLPGIFFISINGSGYQKLVVTD